MSMFNNPLSVAYAHEQQRTDKLLQAIADWRSSTGPQHAIDRRYAMCLLAAEHARRDLKRAEVHAAAQRAAEKRNTRRAA
jgi:hypothetical protein